MHFVKSAFLFALKTTMANIKTTLELVRQKLNESFRNADPRENEDWVILSDIADHEGRLHEEARNKIVMMLVNIQHETVVSTYTSTAPAGNNKYSIVSPPLYIDVFILFFANFYDKNYPEGLEMISRTIGFFQQNLWFTHQSLPGLDPIIDKLTFEITNLDLVDLSYLMGMIGAKYLPSVYYKVRMIPFKGDSIQGEVPAVQGLQAPGEPADEDVIPPPKPVDR